jgi:type IV pilus assembly protein PilW
MSDCSNRMVNQRGVTLTELMVALVLGLATVGAVYSIHLIQVKQRIVQEDIMAMQQNARAAMDLIARELRMAGYDPMGVNRDGSNSNDFPGITHHPTELHVMSDLSGNGVVTDSNESIVFLYDASTLSLRRKIGRGGRQPVAEHIKSFALKYFDQQGVATTDSNSIHMVEVMLTAQTEHADSQYPHNNGHRTFSLRSRIIPRNLSL